MGGYRLSAEFLEKVKAEISETNQKLLASLNGRENPFNTVEYIRILFSESLMEDVEFLDDSSGKPQFKIRHAQIIMRDLLEQVIEFMYLIKHPRLISEYVGEKIDIQSVKKSNPVDGMKKLARGRFAECRQSVASMARDIGEEKSTQGHSALYELYCLLSEECHNSYFFARLDDYKEFKDNKEILALSKDQAENLIIIIDRFLSVYKS